MEVKFLEFFYSEVNVLGEGGVKIPVLFFLGAETQRPRAR